MSRHDVWNRSTTPNPTIEALVDRWRMWCEVVFNLFPRSSLDRNAGSTGGYRDVGFGVAPATGMVKVNLGKVGRALARNRGETMGFHMVQNTPLRRLSPLCHAHLAGLTPHASRLPRVAAAAPLWHFAACVFGSIPGTLGRKSQRCRHLLVQKRVPSPPILGR